MNNELQACPHFGGEALIERLPEAAAVIEFRPVKRGLSESMEEKMSVHTKEGLVRYLAGYLSELFAPFNIEVTAEKLHINHYGYDDRIQWNTYIVKLDGFGVVGFTNGDL